MYEPGVNQQHLWTSMDVPPWNGNCGKFQEGRLLMQRYQYVSVYYKSHDLYASHAETAKKKSVILAGRMVEHATNCARCQEERRFDEEHFYGVYK